MDCGGFTYGLNYIDGVNNELNLIARIEETHVTFGKIFNRINLGSHKISLTATNGVTNPSVSYGNQGLFKSLESQHITINLEDPCFETSI